MKKSDGERRIRLLDDLALADWSEQMSEILSAGMTPEDGLLLMQEDAEKDSAQDSEKNPSGNGAKNRSRTGRKKNSCGAEQELLKDLLTFLEEDGELSGAMERTGFFPEDMVRMVRLGERTGHLENIFRTLEKQYRRQDALRRMVRNAVVYPVVVSGLMILLIAVILTFVMPVFENVYASLDIRFFGLSAVFLSLGSWLGGAGLWILLGIFAAVLILLLVCLHGTGSAVGTAALRNSRELTVCRLSGVLALSFSGGATAEEGIGMAMDLISSERDRAALRESLKELQEGARFSEAIRRAGLYSERDLRRIQIAERTADLDTVMQRIADESLIRLDEETDRRISRIEPILIGILSLVAALILLSVLLPLLSVMSVL